MGYRTDHITAGDFFIAHFILECGLDGARNQILARPEIAREFSLERLPNSACRQLLARADGGANASRDRSLDVLIRNRRVIDDDPDERDDIRTVSMQK